MTDGDVLIVDDDADMVETISMVLSDDGYECRSARNGREALAAVDAKRPRLVLLDMMMPVMNGWDCAHELRAKYGHDIRVIAVTAAEHACARARQAEADGVLSKPFNIEALKSIVKRFIGPAEA